MFIQYLWRRKGGRGGGGGAGEGERVFWTLCFGPVCIVVMLLSDVIAAVWLGGLGVVFAGVQWWMVRGAREQWKRSF